MEPEPYKSRALNAEIQLIHAREEQDRERAARQAAEARLAAVIHLCDIRDRNRMLRTEPTDLSVSGVRAAATGET